jgi:hypothetical protein
MKAIEMIATINNQGQLFLAQPLTITTPNRIRVIVLIPEDSTKLDPDDTPTEVVLEGLRQGLHEALTEQTIRVSDRL